MEFWSVLLIQRAADPQEQVQAALEAVHERRLHRVSVPHDMPPGVRDAYWWSPAAPGLMVRFYSGAGPIGRMPEPAEVEDRVIRAMSGTAIPLPDDDAAILMVPGEEPPACIGTVRLLRNGRTAFRTAFPAPSVEVALCRMGVVLGTHFAATVHEQSAIRIARADWEFLHCDAGGLHATIHTDFVPGLPQDPLVAGEKLVEAGARQLGENDPNVVGAREILRRLRQGGLEPATRRALLDEFAREIVNITARL